MKDMKPCTSTDQEISCYCCSQRYSEICPAPTEILSSMCCGKKNTLPPTVPGTRSWAHSDHALQPIKSGLQKKQRKQSCANLHSELGLLTVVAVVTQDLDCACARLRMPFYQECICMQSLEWLLSSTYILLSCSKHVTGKCKWMLCCCFFQQFLNCYTDGCTLVERKRFCLIEHHFFFLAVLQVQ